MQIIHHLSIDLARQLPMPPIGAVQGDANTRAVEIALLENGEPWKIPEGITAAVAFRKPDKTKGLYDTLPDGTKAVTIDGSTVTAVLAPQVLSCAGEVRAAVAFLDGQLNQLATFPFVIRAAANPAAGQSVSNDYYCYSTMEEVSAAVEAALAAMEDSKQAFLAKAEEALSVVHETATEDAPAIICEASGETVTAADAANRPLSGLSLYGKTTQDGTPTPEVPAALVSVGAGGAVNTTVCGKNLLPYPFAETSKTAKGVTFTDNGDGSITASGTTADGGVNFTFVSRLIIPAGKYKVFRSGDLTGFTLYLWKEVRDDAGNLTSDILTAKLAANGYAEFEITADDAAANTELLINMNTPFSGQAISGTCCCMITDASITDNSYEPYMRQTLTASTPNGLPGIPVESGGNYTDENGQQWVCDEVDFARGVYIQRLKDKVFDGTEVFGTSSSYAGRYTTALSNAKAVGEIISNAFKGVAASTSAERNVCYISQSAALCINTFFETADDFKTYLAGQYNSGTPVAVLYALATPIETPLSAGELAAFAALHSNYPNTTVFNDGGAGMKLSYVADTKTYTDNKLAAISAAILS